MLLKAVVLSGCNFLFTNRKKVDEMRPEDHLPKRISFNPASDPAWQERH